MKKLEDNFKENGGSWKEYKIGDLFYVTSSKKIFHANNLNIYEKNEFNTYPYVVRKTVNNGIRGYIKENEIYLNEENTLSFAQDTFTVFYQNKPYFTGNNIKILKCKYNKLNEKNSLFFVSAFNLILKDFSWGIGSTIDSISNINISLPTINNEIAFDFMEAYICELEKEHVFELEEERVRELTTYLKVSGLENYTLTKDEEKALDIFIYNKIKYKKFKLKVLFDIKSSKKKFNANTVKFNGIYPYVARGSSNNGIRGYISEDTIFLNEENTISFGQDTATIYYQEQPYFTGDKIKILKYKHKTLNANLSFYLITCIKKVFSNFLWGQSSFKENIIKKTEIKLPINDNKEIDYVFIENFIKAQQKLAIKSVIEWKDEIIENTKKIIS